MAANDSPFLFSRSETVLSAQIICCFADCDGPRNCFSVCAKKKKKSLAYGTRQALVRVCDHGKKKKKEISPRTAHSLRIAGFYSPSGTDMRCASSLSAFTSRAKQSRLSRRRSVTLSRPVRHSECSSRPAAALVVAPSPWLARVSVCLCARE